MPASQIDANAVSESVLISGGGIGGLALGVALHKVRLCTHMKLA